MDGYLYANSKLHLSCFLPPHNVLIQPFAKSNYSFLPATISLWNNLPLDALTLLLFLYLSDLFVTCFHDTQISLCYCVCLFAHVSAVHVSICF